MTKRTRKRKSWPAEARRVVEVFLTGLAGGTVAAYEMDLRRFARFMRARSVPVAVRRLICDGAGPANELARRYQGDLRQRSAANTVNRRLAALSSLTRTAREIGVIDWRLTIKPLPTTPMRDTAGPGRANVRKMVEHARAGGGEKGLRDVALLLLLYGLALRREEVVELDMENVDLTRPAVSVMGKGKVEREWLDMPLLVQEALAAWMVARGDGDGPLFLTASRAHPRRRLTAGGLYSIVRSIGEAVGVTTSPHGLRHTAITDAILMNHSLLDVQRFSRHADLRTLQIYYDRVRGVAVDIANDVVNGL